MSDLKALKSRQKERFFEGWDDFVDPEHVKASETSLRQLIDDLIALGAKPTEKKVRKAVDQCVRRFNKMDGGWINTIEREDIYDVIGDVVELTGFECEENWLDERDW
jgi:hypothetical protein